MVTKSNKEADAEFAEAINESIAKADETAPATTDDRVEEQNVDEESGFLIFKATADDAIKYLRASEDRDEVYALAQAEENGKARKTVIEAAMRRATELNLLEDEAREVANTVMDDKLKAPDLGTVKKTEEAVVSPDSLGDPEEYPISAREWDGELGRYTELKHITRTMNPLGGLDDRVMTPTRVNEYIEDHFLEGFELVRVIPQGFGSQGLSLLWVLGKVRADEKPKHTEIWHIQRTLTESTMVEGGVTGFQADQYLNSFLRDGWQLFVAQSLRTGEPEIPMLWVMVR